MGFTTFANGKSVAGQATGHWAVNTSPDTCILPDDSKEGFANEIPSAKLGSGQTAITMLCGQPIWTEKGKLDAGPSGPDHAGKKGGVTSGTYCSYAEPVDWSRDVKAEGGGVVRLGDPTLQNAGNCDGIVKDGPGGGATSAATGGDAGEDDAAVDGDLEGPGTDAGPEGPEDDDDGAVEDPVGDEGEPEEEIECKLVATRIQCGHGRSPSGQDLEVLEGDTIKFEGDFEGECPDATHPLWTMSGGSPATLVGAEGSMEVSGGAGLETISSGGIASVLRLAYLSTAEPTSYTLKVEAHDGNDQYKIDAYPADRIVSGNLIPDKLREVLARIQAGFGKLSDKSGKVDFDFQLLNGSLQVAGGWEEHTDHRCFFGFDLIIGFRPLIGLWAKFCFPWGPYEWLHQLLDWLGCRIDLYIELGGAIDLVGSVGRHAPGPIPGLKIAGSRRLTLSIGVEITLGEDNMGAEARGRGKIGCPISVSCAQLFNADVVLTAGPLAIGPITLEASVWACGFFLRKAIVRAGGNELYDPKKKRQVAKLGIKGNLMDKKAVTGKLEGVLIKAG